MKFLVLCLVMFAVCNGAPQSPSLVAKLRTIGELKQQIAERKDQYDLDKSASKKEKNLELDEQKKIKEEQQAALFKEQAENAHYEFESLVDDGINDHAHYRTEKRDGLAVEGSYAYSDGFFRRTVHYVADDKGFRIVKEENEPIGDGPVIDPNGKAVVKAWTGGEYTITLDDYQKRQVKKVET